MELKIKCVNTTTSSDGSQYGKFVIEPLEKGFGTTIGNSLRRVLLSSLEGTAVTSARIEGITHEYTAIPGVLEDVIDVMLNLKGLVVKTDSPEPQHLRIDVDKPGAVLACDIQLPAGVKVVNPDWLICTVAEGGSFHADVIVETGKGYEPHDVPRDSKNVSIAERQDGTQYIYFNISQSVSYSGIPHGGTVDIVNEGDDDDYPTGTTVRFSLTDYIGNTFNENFKLYQSTGGIFTFIHEDTSHAFDWLWVSGRSLKANNGSISGTIEIIIE